MTVKDKIKELDSKFLNKFLFRRLNTRKVHLYCTGLFKSGTHSIHNIFKKYCRSEHEPDNIELMNLYFKIERGEVSTKRLQKIVAKREKRLYLEMNSCGFNYLILEQLLKLYPEAKYIHTIRDPYSWLDSWINHDLNHDFMKITQRYFDENFKRDKIPYAKEEEILKDLNLPTIDGMLSYWQNHNLSVLRKVPPNKLLVVKTKDISDEIDVIIKFAGLSKLRDNVDSHAYKAKKKHHILDKMDEKFVKQKLGCYSLEAVDF
jgi:hypothetical protein